MRSLGKLRGRKVSFSLQLTIHHGGRLGLELKEELETETMDTCCFLDPWDALA